MAMAMLEAAGVCGMIDERTRPDPQRLLTPGKAVKLMVGALFNGMGRRALYKLDRDYASAPVDLLCGKGLTADNLNARAFSRALDDLFGADLPDLMHEIYRIFAKKYGIVAFLYNMDSTNFGVTAVTVERDDVRAAIPEWNGHAKDGNNSRRVYNLQSVTDQEGVTCFERPYDGTVSDSRMDADTVVYLSEHSDVPRSTIIADSKIVNRNLVALIEDAGFGFVSKCPESFGDKAKESIVRSALTGVMDDSSYGEGWQVYDCDSEVDGRKLRFVAFRTPEECARGKEYLRAQGLRAVEKSLAKYAKRTFSCERDAVEDFDRTVGKLKGSAYIVRGSVRAIGIEAKRGTRGRPPKGSAPPQTATRYAVDVEWEFSEELAEELTADRQVRVLVTNLPRSTGSHNNPRDGATADDVLRLYMGQFRIERSFRTSKSVFDVDCVYLHRPSRANAFMFVVSVATMLSGVIAAVMRRKGIRKTAEAMMDDLSTVMVKHDSVSGTEFLEGDERSCGEFLAYLDALGIDPDGLFRSR